MQYNITYREKDKGIQFIISYKDNGGNWKQKSKQGFKTKREAKLAADSELGKLKEVIALRSTLNAQYEEITFKEFTTMFVEHEKLYKEWNTIQSYITAFSNFTLLNALKMSKIKNADIQKCIDTLVRKGLKTITIKRYLAKINIVFKSAISQFNILNNSPIQNISILKDKNTQEKAALTSNELSILLSKIENKDYYIISILAGKCGLRIGEVMGLTWSDIDDKNHIIKVTKQWKKLKDGNYGFGELKSKNSNRIVPVSFKIMSELLKFKNQSPLNINGRLFKQCSTLGMSRALLLTYKKLGFNISVHELRHTYATMLISNGVDFKTAAKLLGHDIDQTMKTYSHVTDDMISFASKIINNIF